MGLVAAVRDIEADLITHEAELHMRLFAWATDEVLMQIADEVYAKTSRIDSFPRWGEIIEAPFSYQLLSLRRHEDARSKVFNHMSFEQLVFVENEARRQAGDDTIDEEDDASWMMWSRQQARHGEGVFDRY